MRKAVLIGTDLAYDSRGKLVPLEINTNVGWDKVNRKETPEEIFDFTELSTYVREHTIKEICLEGKIAEICKDLIQAAVPDVSVKTVTISDLDKEYPDTTLVVRTAWSPVALVDSFAANKEKFKKLIRNEDFSEDFKIPEGNLPNLVVKAIKPQYNKSEYPKFYKADVTTLKVPNGFIVEPAVLNVKNLVEGRIPVFRNWSLFVTDGLNIDSIYLGTYTKVCGEEFDESKLEYDSHGALIRGREMLVSLDDLSTQWPADALLETTDEVLMSDGSWKKASDLAIGDKVKSLDLGETDIRHTGDVQISIDEISNLSEASVDFLTRTRGYRDFVEITFKDKSTWFDTGKSAYMIKSEKQVRFVNIEDLKKDDVVYFLDVKTSKLSTKVVKSAKVVRKYADTYNVSLGGNHVFYSRGAGETSAFASIEHNDTSDCQTDPKSAAGSFQSFISVEGNTELVNYVNIASTGINVTDSGNNSTIKQFKVSPAASASHGAYMNPNDYSAAKGGFSGCWYPLEGTNATWNINIPKNYKSNTEYLAAILRRGSINGDALGKSRGGSESWKLFKRDGNAIVLPVKFTLDDGPCSIYVTLKKPVEVVTLTDTNDESIDAAAVHAKTRHFSFPSGKGAVGSVHGTVEATDSWVSPSVSSFDDSSTSFGVSVSENAGFDDRSAKVRVLINDGSVSALAVEYTVSQAGKNLVLSVSPTSFNVPATGGRYNSTVSTNGSYTIGEVPTWIEASKLGDAVASFTVAENTEFIQRTGTVTITATGGSQTKSETVTLVQAANILVLTVSPTSFSVPAAGGEYNSTVSTNGSYTIGEVPTWIEASKLGDAVASFTVAENTEFIQRTGTVTITATGGSQTKSETVTLVQAANIPVLTVSPESIVFDTASGELRTVTVTSNAPWQITNSVEGTNYWRVETGGSGTGNGSFTVRSDYPGTKYYTCDGSNVRLPQLNISTKIGISGVAEIVKTINMYCKSTKFVAPTLDTVETDVPLLFESYGTCREPVSGISVGMWVCLDDGLGNEDCSYQIDPDREIYQYNGTDNSTSTGFAFIHCEPISFGGYVGSGGVTGIKVTGSSGLGDTPVGFAYLRKAENSTWGAIRVMCSTASVVNLQSEVTFESTSSMQVPSNWDSITGASDDALCFVVGTGSAEIEPGSTVDLALTYYNDCTDTDDTVVRRFTFRSYPAFEINTADYVTNNPWSAYEGSGGSTIPASGDDVYPIAFSGLTKTAKYRLLVSDAVQSVYAGDRSINFADGVSHTGEAFMNQEGTTVAVKANTSSNSRNVIVALVPEDNGTVEDINNLDLFNQCLLSGGSRNGKFYQVLVASQDGAGSVTQKDNTITLECNPFLGNENLGKVFYDVTASAQYPVSSALSIVANTVDGNHATSMGEDITLTLAQGSSKISGSRVGVQPGDDRGFGYENVQFVADPAVPGTVTATVSPTSDSTYNYRIGNVKVRNFPTLANMPATLYVGTQSSFLVSNEAIPGLEISSSNTAVNVCKLETQANGSVNAILGNSALAASDPWIYLKRGEQVLCSASIETATHTKPSLTVEPASSTVPVDGGIETVRLYDENSNLVDADSIDKGVGISEVTRISTGEYRVFVSSKTAGSVSRTVFKKSGYSDATFTVTWQDVVVDDGLKVWFNSGGQEILLSGQDLRLLGNVSATPSQVNGNFDFTFRYENASAKRWKPVLSNPSGEEIAGAVRIDLTDNDGYTTATAGNFVVRISGRVGAQHQYGDLSFDTPAVDGLIIPISSQIITDIN